eukprot:Opistho-2@76530
MRSISGRGRGRWTGYNGVACWLCECAFCQRVRAQRPAANDGNLLPRPLNPLHTTPLLPTVILFCDISSSAISVSPSDHHHGTCAAVDFQETRQRHHRTDADAGRPSERPTLIHFDERATERTAKTNDKTKWNYHDDG